MDPIDSLSKLIEILRRQQTAETDKPRRPRGSRAEKNTRRSMDRPSLAQLEQRIIERLRGVDNKENPQRAARTFFEAILAWEFGEELIQDPRFAEMVHEVESRMRSDPALSERLDRLLQRMMKA